MRSTARASCSSCSADSSPRSAALAASPTGPRSASSAARRSAASPRSRPAGSRGPRAPAAPPRAGGRRRGRRAPGAPAPRRPALPPGPPSSAAKRSSGASIERRVRRALARQLPGLGEASLGHGLAGAVAQPDHQRRLGGDVAGVRVGARRPVRVQRAVDHRHGAVDLGRGQVVVRASLGEPGRAGLAVGQRLGLDHGRAARGHGLGARLLHHRAPAAAQAAALGRAEGPEHEDALRPAAGLGAHDEAPVRRTEQEAELELYEGER